jgi:voltage-gated potassium channel
VAHTDSSVADTPHQRSWQRALEKFFSKLWVELSLGVLIIASVILTITQVILEGPGGQETPGLESMNQGITWFFALEMFLRFIAHPAKRWFVREYWADLLALLPLLQVLPEARAFRLLRLLRVLRLLGFLNRLTSHFPYILRKGATEYLVVTGILLLTVLIGAGAMLALEGRADNPDMDSWDDAFWFSVYSLFAGEPIPAAPHTVAGRLTSVIIMFMGVTIFAMFTGTVSAFMVQRLQSEGRVLTWDHFSDHIIVCGWNSKAEIVIREYQAAHRSDEQPIVVIADLAEDFPHLPPDLRDRIQFLDDDFTRVDVLEQAGIHRANTCIILSDISGGRSEQDADARTILAALTVEKMSSKVYTCAELHNRDYGTHLEMGGVNDYVISGEHSAYLLAQAALNRGLMEIFSELLTHERGNQFYRLPVPEAWLGGNFFDLFIYLKRERQAILVAVYTAEGKNLVNPDDHVFAPGDELVIIAEQEVVL